MHSKKNHFQQQRNSIFQKIGIILFLFAFFIFQAMPPAFADITLRPEGRAASYRSEMSASTSAPIAQQNIPSAQTSAD
ncbi:MAG TPA: hypothetical protein PLO78_04465 [Candidatus Omnitrophota bacterium]|nr:hypothetical protein [Candidatus Omnitrophota bacterium]